MAFPVQSRGFQLQRVKELGFAITGAASRISTGVSIPYDDSDITSDVAALQAAIALLQSQDIEHTSDISDLDHRLTDLGWIVEGVIRTLPFETYTGGEDFGAFADAVTATKDLGDFGDPTTTFADEYFVERPFYIDCGSFA